MPELPWRDHEAEHQRELGARQQAAIEVSIAEQARKERERLEGLEKLAQGLAAWDKRWPKGTIFPTTMQRQCETELAVLCTLAETLTKYNGEG